MQQQQQQQEEGQKQPRRMLAAPAPAPVMYPQQQQQQQQQQHQHWQQQQQFYVGSHGDSSQPSSRRDYPTNLQQQQQGLDQEQLSQQGAMRQLQRQSEPSQDALLELVAKATQVSCPAV
jgi:sex-determining region Y protein (SOX group A)